MKVKNIGIFSFTCLDFNYYIDQNGVVVRVLLEMWYKR